MTKACILSVSGPVLLPGEAQLLSAHQPWGVILMGRSCVSKGQVRDLVDSIWSALGRKALIFIDQEGGRVARLKAPEWPRFPPPRAYGELYKTDPDLGAEAAWLGHRLIASELGALGIYADCAPVVDIPVAGAHDVIGDRAFSLQAEAVTELAKAALDGLRAGGVAGVIKHIPGHGRADVDTHAGLPRISASKADLEAEFEAFSRLAHAPMAMSAHIAYEAIDPGVPATQSRKVIEGIIRKRIGFDGLLMTDDLGMEALGGTLALRASRALDAGCEVILHCSGFVKTPEGILAEMTEVAETVPHLTGDALARAERAERWAGEATPFDLQAGWARFHELFPQTRGVA